MSIYVVLIFQLESPPPLYLHDGRYPDGPSGSCLRADVDSPVADGHGADGQRLPVGGGAHAGVGQEGVVANLKFKVSWVPD